MTNPNNDERVEVLKCDLCGKPIYEGDTLYEFEKANGNCPLVVCQECVIVAKCYATNE